jgi:peptidoglycan/LPS O-acetylase OafA/YrhL
VSQLSADMHDATHSRTPSQLVDKTDWLKTAAIIFVSVGHFGFFFMEDDRWWGVFGRFAAPPFFFFVGYAQSRTVPLYWIWIGIGLTLLESWNADWTWVAPNILLSFVCIRIARPYAQKLIQNYSWAGLALLLSLLIIALPVAAKGVDYGAEGWLWALFGLCQRRYLDCEAAVGNERETQRESSLALDAVATARLMRLLVCLVAAVVFVWQEQKEFSFPAFHLAIFVLGLTGMSVSLCHFRRGESRIQPPAKLARVLRFIGRHTLEIYAIQLAGSELIVKLAPELAP